MHRRVGADHHGYVPRMKAAITCRSSVRKDFHVVLNQMVNLMRGGEPVAMSTRSANSSPCREVLDDVGTDAARFMFLSRKSDSPLDIDLDLVKQRNMENPVYYVQYAYARVPRYTYIYDRGVVLPERCTADMLAPLTSADDLALLREAERFRNVVEDAARSRAAHPVSFYSWNLRASCTATTQQSRAERRRRGRHEGAPCAAARRERGHCQRP